MKFKSVDHDKKPVRSLDGFLTKTKPAATKPLHTLETNTAPLDDIYIDENTEPKAEASEVDQVSKDETSPTTRKPDIEIEDEPSRKERRREKQRQKKLGFKKERKGRKVAKRTVLSIALVLFLIFGWVGWKFYRNAAKITGNNNPLNLLSVFHNVPLKNTDGRTNILVAGNSTDDPGHDGANLTDSIMVLSIDNANHNAMILSVPRDLWVAIPGMGHQKINAANTVTTFKQAGYPDGGMGALESIVSKNLGITIHYYALINYGAFKDTVNALGGITINIESPDKRGLYDPNISPVDGGPLKLANGQQKLTGQTALNLARARGDSYYSYGFPQSDFDRTMHQRQMLIGVKDKATSAGVLTNPLKVGQLADAVGKNVQTDLKLNEIQSLVNQTKDLNNSNITSVNINNLNGDKELMLKNYTSENGQSALIPAAGVDDYSAIQKAIKKLISNNPIAKEEANVVVLNGSTTEGLSKQYAAKLDTKGIVVSITANAPSSYPTTTLIDNSQNKLPATFTELKNMFGTNITTNATLTATYPNADFIVILGANASMPQ